MLSQNWMFHSSKLGREKTWASGYEILMRPHVCLKRQRETERERGNKNPFKKPLKNPLLHIYCISYALYTFEGQHPRPIPAPNSVAMFLPTRHHRYQISEIRSQFLLINREIHGFCWPQNFFGPWRQPRPRHWKALLRLHGAQLQLLQRHHLARVDLAGAVDHAIGAFVDASAGDAFYRSWLVV